MQQNITCSSNMINVFRVDIECVFTYTHLYALTYAHIYRFICK